MTIELRKPTEQEQTRLQGMTIAQLGREGWIVRSAFYHPRTGIRHPAAWVHLEQGIGPVEISASQHRELQALGEYRWWHGEHDNNGPSWQAPVDGADESESWTFSTREIYEFIDEALPYNERFRTLRFELQIYRGEENLGVVALSSERWYALAEMALAEGRAAAAAGL